MSSSLADSVLDLRRAGRHAEAIALCEATLASNPTDNDALQELPGLLREAGRLEEMEAHLHTALQHTPNDLDLYRRLAAVYTGLKYHGKALEILTALTRAAPLQLKAQADLADLLLETYDVEEAADVCRFALACEPEGHLACRLHNALGRSLWHLGQGEEALDNFQAALGFAGTYNPIRFTCLSNILATLQSLGRTSEIRKMCLSLLVDLQRWSEHLPSMGSVLFQLALVDAIPDDSEFHQLLKGMAAEDLHPDTLAHVHFALARIDARAKRHDAAMGHYIAGGQAKRAAVPDASLEIDLREMARQREVFTPELIARFQDSGLQAEEPVFIVGMPRSGTTLIEQVLGAHDGVAAAGELPYFPYLVAGRAPASPTLAREGYPRWLTRPGAPDILRVVAATYLHKIRRRYPDARRIVDKMPVNFLTVGTILLAFPKARIIHARRHPLDGCVACFTTLFETDGYTSTHDLSDLGHYYRGYLDLMDHWHTVFPGRILDVHYEDMVTDLEGQSRRLMDYVGLPWDPACLTFYESKTAVRTASFAQVRQPVHTGSVGRWRVYEKHLGPLIDALGLPGLVEGETVR